MDHKSIEVVLCAPEEDSQAFNTPFLTKRLKKQKRLLALIVAVTLVAGLLFGLARGIINGIGTVTAMVSFSYEGVEKGEDPNGAVFDINKMKAPVILDAALAETGITSVTLEDLRNSLTFEGVVPTDVQERIATLQTIGEKTPAALEQILEISYHPSQYKLTLNIRKLGLSGPEGTALLTAVMDQYRTWFFKTYGGASSLGGAIAAMDLTGYDYAEALDILETQSRIISNYLRKLQAEDPTFRSAETGFTFSDLQNQLSILSDVDIPKLNSLILSTGLTRDRTSLEAYYNYQIQMATTELTKIQEQRQGIESAIASYQKDSIVIMGSAESGMQTTMNQTSEEYDNLFQQRTQLDSQVAEQQQRLTILLQRLEGLRGTETNPVSPTQLATAKAKVEENLPVLSTKLTNLISVINQTADEYYETVAFKTAYQISLPAQTFASGLMGLAVEGIKFGVVGGVLGVMIACAVLLLPPLFTGELYVKKTQRTRKEETSAE